MYPTSPSSNSCSAQPGANAPLAQATGATPPSLHVRPHPATQSQQSLLAGGQAKADERNGSDADESGIGEPDSDEQDSGVSDSDEQECQDHGITLPLAKASEKC